MERTAVWGFFAERYGWTQKQALEENQEWYLQRLPALAAVIDELKAEAERKSAAAAKSGARR